MLTEFVARSHGRITTQRHRFLEQGHVICGKELHYYILEIESLTGRPELTIRNWFLLDLLSHDVKQGQGRQWFT